jgi:putative Holliday junction resolvase
VLALDVGNKRVGVAMASLMVRLPRPLLTLDRDNSLFAELIEVINREDVGAIVVGWPRGLDGQDTGQTRATQSFIDELRQQITGLPIYKQDEALTSKQAEEELQARGKNYNKGDIDSLAASYILDDWLSVQPKTEEAKGNNYDVAA